MTQLTINDVETIAELAKLPLTETEKALFQEQLSSILDYAELIQQVDTSGVLPATSALSLNNVMRADVATLSFDNEEALANAPQAEQGQFKVRAVLD